MEQEQAKTQAQVPDSQAEVQDDSKIREIEEKYKKEIAGLNKRVSEFEKKTKALEAEKLTEAEKIALAQKDLEEERTTLRNQLKEYTIKEALVGAGLSIELARSISGESKEEIAASVKTLKGILDSEAKKIADAEINKRLGGRPPTGGVAETVTGLQAQYDKAKKEGRVADSLAIKRVAATTGEQIKD